MCQNRKDSCQSWIYLSFTSLITFFVFGFLDAYGVLLVFLVQHFNEKNSKAGMFDCIYIFVLNPRRQGGYL